MMPLHKYIAILLVLVAGRLLLGQEGPTEQNNLVTYGITFSTAYDDRQTFAGGSSGGIFSSVQPQVALKLLRRRWESSINYLPAFNYSTQPTSSYEPISQAFGLTLTNRISKRLTFSLQNNFTITSNPFDTIQANTALPQFSVLDRPNSTIPTTSLSRRMEQAVATVSYALGPHSTIGIGGNFMYLDYRGTRGSSVDGIRRSVDESGNIFYNRQIGPRSSMGFRYTFQKLDFGHGLVTTTSHNLIYQFNREIIPGLDLSAFAGPDYSETRSESLPTGVPLQATQLSAVGGVTLTWKAGRNVLSAGGVREITDGGGARGNVVLDSFDVEMSRQISSHVTVRAFVNYNRNHLLLPLIGVPPTFNYLAGGAELNRNLTAHTSLGLVYLRMQDDPQAGAGSLSGNRFGIRLSYNHQRPLGR